MIRVVADSGCDLYKLDGFDFKSAPLKIIGANKEFVDEEGLNIREMIDLIKEHEDKSSTSCPNIQEWLDAFGDSEEIIAFSITSALSGSYSAACQARDIYLQEHPNAKVTVFDSQLTGPGLTVIIDHLKELLSKNVSYQECVDDLKTYITHCGLVFCLCSLNNMARNGRVPSIVAKGIGLLNIRIVCAAVEGKVHPIGQCRGEKKAKLQILKALISRGYNGGKVRIHHVFNEAMANDLALSIKEKFPQAEPIVQECHGMNSYYAEEGAILIGFEH